MDTVKLIVQILAAFSGSLVALFSIMLFIRVKWPSPVGWLLKLFVSALTSIFILIAALCIIAGISTGSIYITVIGIYDILVYLVHIYFVTRAPDSLGSFEKAFGTDWENLISAGQKKYFLARRSAVLLPSVPKPRFEQNIVFSTIPGTERNLLCDLWLPNENVTPSGLAFIYLFGSAWFILDKDLGTRPFFSHLAAQGHVIMDVAYRLAPETDMKGMVNDAQRAINWMKENSVKYGVDPNRIVIGGGSAGAHIALLTAYTANNQQFIANELEGKDLNVHAVISIYGPTDLMPMYYHTNQHLTTRSNMGEPKKAVKAGMPGWVKKKMGKDYYRLHFDKGFENAGTFVSLFGCHPDECPETYELFSPVTHVHAQCPSTLLIHGEHDTMVPVKSARSLYSRLIEEKVPAVMHILPQSDHAFDLILPKISLSAHAAIYDVERFLALNRVSQPFSPLEMVGNNTVSHIAF